MVGSSKEKRNAKGGRGGSLPKTELKELLRWRRSSRVGTKEEKRWTPLFKKKAGSLRNESEEGGKSEAEKKKWRLQENDVKKYRSWGDPETGVS